MRAIRMGKYFISSAIVAAMLCAAPARADDDAEKTGLIAALGLSAADGKTTLGDGAGATEAALLTTLLIDQSGAAIAQSVGQASNGRKVLVVGADETVSLFAVAVVKERIQRITRLLRKTKCSGKGSSEERWKFFDEKTTFLPSDIVAAVATSTNYASVPVSLSDRMLLNAVAMHTTQRPRLAYPAEIVGAPTGGTVLNSYQDMLSAADALRACGDSADIKAALSTADAYVESLNTPADKGLATPLMLAAQFEGLGNESTYVLRVAIEKQGGTAITRSGIWYTIGFPGAATISAGLIASFRLTDTTTGVVVQTGFVTCAIAPIKFASVARTVLNDKGDLVRCRLLSGPH